MLGRTLTYNRVLQEFNLLIKEELMRMSFPLLITLCFVAFACQPAPVQVTTAPRVAIDTGILEGAFVASDSEVAVFKGIPFAAPPVGELRWAPTLPAESWEDVRHATDFGPACPQSEMDEYYQRMDRDLGGEGAIEWAIRETREDCLYLNVWTSNLGGQEKLPVMLWIHGGANLATSGSQGRYNGAHLSEKGAVVVTFNYRLGVLGFMAHPALTAESANNSSGNYALLDQIEALRWVQRNIAVFGGDPNRVTIFGVSAGGTDVTMLMASPLSKGLFHRAISQSGNGLSPRPLLETSEALGEKLAQGLGIEDDANLLTTLRQKTAEQIMEVAYKSPREASQYGPIIDGWVLDEPPAVVFSTGRQHGVPLLIGSTANEGTTLAPLFFPDADEKTYQAVIQTTYGAFADRVLELYSVAKCGDVPRALGGWFTDMVFGAPARFQAAAMAKTKSKAYLYHFTRVPPEPGDKLGAFHSSDVYLLFNTQPDGWPKNPYDAALTDAMSGYWVQFAATGDPNREGLPEWPPYDSTSDQHLELGETIKVETGLRKEANELMDEIIDSRVQEWKKKTT